MESEKIIDVLTRRQLYDEIWQISVAGVARKYNVVYARLMAVCKSESIPYPSSGYWTKKNMGKDVSGESVALSGDENKEILLSTLRSPLTRTRKTKLEKSKFEDKKPELPVHKEAEIDIQKDELKTKEAELISIKSEETTELLYQDFLLFLNNDERERVLLCAQNLKIEENARLHKILIRYKKEVTDYKTKLKEAQNNPYYNHRYNKPQNEPEFFKEISEAEMQRAFVILDALFKAIETLGGSVNNDLSVNIREDTVRFRMAESQDQIKHELTKQEAQELVKYNDDVKHGRWASKPQIRKYDKVYNGKLRIVIGERRYIRDSSTEKLEDRLGDILISLYEKSEEIRIAREAREAEERKRKEEERLREEKRKRKEQEIKRVIELANLAEDYRIATEIRAYINAMIESGKEKPESKWVEWAKKKADWYDPTIACEDEFLGLREHGKSKEDKEKALQDSVSMRRGWYW